MLIYTRQTENLHPGHECFPNKVIKKNLPNVVSYCTSSNHFAENVGFKTLAKKYFLVCKYGAPYNDTAVTRLSRM